jgi:hypothetical protein
MMSGENMMTVGAVKKAIFVEQTSISGPQYK